MERRSTWLHSRDVAKSTLATVFFGAIVQQGVWPGSSIWWTIGLGVVTLFSLCWRTAR